MSQSSPIPSKKQPRPPHHIKDWAERMGLTAADLARATGADKGLVSRWYRGTSPGDKWQIKLAQLFRTDRDGLFRHPDEDWFWRKMSTRTAEERRRIIDMINAAFPDEKQVEPINVEELPTARKDTH